MKYFRRCMCALLALAVLLALAPVSALSDGGDYDEVALVFGGRQITRGRGFQKNVMFLTPAQLDEICDSNDGSVAYKYGFGDSLLPSARAYSSHDNHELPIWHFNRVLGFDLKLLAEAAGIATDQKLTIAVTASDGMMYSLEDAFATETKRYYYSPEGEPVSEAGPVLALYRTVSTTYDEPAPGGAVQLPSAPTVGAGSPNAVAPLFGYGQDGIFDENGCHWVHDVTKLRFGGEDVALTVKNNAGQTSTTPISYIVSYGIWYRTITQGSKSVDAMGIPLPALLEKMGVAMDGKAIIAASQSGETITLGGSDINDAFVAWEAMSGGIAVKNNTPLRLYTADGELADLVSLQISGVSAPTTPPGLAFADLAGYDWALEAISRLVSKEIVTGTSETTFSPAANLKRGDFALMLYRAVDLSPLYSGADTRQFADVPGGSYYHDAIYALKRAGIAQGDGENFNPESSITRQDAMVLIFRTLAPLGTDFDATADLSAFPDAGDVADYAADVISALVAAGVINGKDGRLAPADNMTRAEMAVSLNRALTHIV